MGKPFAKVVQIAGRCRPTPRLQRLATVLHGPQFATSINLMVEDSIAVNALAELLDRAMTACTTKDGRLDLREMAMFVIKEMRGAQR